MCGVLVAWRVFVCVKMLVCECVFLYVYVSVCVSVNTCIVYVFLFVCLCMRMLFIYVCLFMRVLYLCFFCVNACVFVRVIVCFCDSALPTSRHDNAESELFFVEID